MNVSDANKILTKYVNESPRRFEYLLNLADLWDDFSISHISKLVTIFDERVGKYSRKNSNSSCDKELPKYLHVLETKNVGITVKEKTVTINHVEFMYEKEDVGFEKHYEYKINGYRRRGDIIVGTRLDLQNFSLELHITMSETKAILKLLLGDFDIFDKLFNLENSGDLQ